MKPSNIAIELIKVAQTFGESQAKSMYTLLKETGCFDLWEEVLVPDIREALAGNPDLISEWMQYSEDKRASSGWYIKQGESDRFIVGHLDDTGSHESKKEYVNSLDACAAFIGHEIDEIRELSSLQ